MSSPRPCTVFTPRTNRRRRRISSSYFALVHLNHKDEQKTKAEQIFVFSHSSSFTPRTNRRRGGVERFFVLLLSLVYFKRRRWNSTFCASHSFYLHQGRVKYKGGVVLHATQPSLYTHKDEWKTKYLTVNRCRAYTSEEVQS